MAAGPEEAAPDGSAEDDVWSLSPSACSIIDRLLALAASERRRLRLERALRLYDGATSLLADPRSEAQSRSASLLNERREAMGNPESLVYTALTALLEALDRSRALEHDLSGEADDAAEAFAAAAKSLRDHREAVWRDGGTPAAVRLPTIAGASGALPEDVGAGEDGGGVGGGGEGGSNGGSGGGGSGCVGGSGEGGTDGGGGGEGGGVEGPASRLDSAPPSRESLELEAWVGTTVCCRLLGRTDRYAELMAHLRAVVIPPPVEAGVAPGSAVAAASPPHPVASAVALLSLLDELFSGLGRLARGEVTSQGSPPPRTAEVSAHCGALVQGLSHSLPNCWRALGEWDHIASRAALLRSHRLAHKTELGRSIPVVCRPSPGVLDHLQLVVSAGGGRAEDGEWGGGPAVGSGIAKAAWRALAVESRLTARDGGANSFSSRRAALLGLCGGGGSQQASPAPRAGAVGEALIQAGIRLLASGRPEEACAAFDHLDAWAAREGWEWALVQEPARGLPERGVVEPPKGTMEPARGLFEMPMAVARCCMGWATLGEEGDGAGRVLREEAFGAFTRADARLAESLARPPRLAADRDTQMREAAGLFLAQLQARWQLSCLLEAKGQHRPAEKALRIPITRVPLRAAHASLCRAVPKLRRAAARAQMRRAELLLLVATRARRGAAGGGAGRARGGTSSRSEESEEGEEEGEGGEGGEGRRRGAGTPGGAEEAAAMDALEGVTDLVGDRDGLRALRMLCELHARHGEMGDAAAAVGRAGEGQSLLMAHLLALQGKEREAAQTYRQVAVALHDNGQPSARAWFGRSMSRARQAAALLQSTVSAKGQDGKPVTSAAAQLAARQAEEALVEAQEAARRALVSDAECPGALDARQLWYGRQVYGTLAARVGRSAEAAAALRAAAAMGETLMPRGGKVASNHALANALSETDRKAAVAASDEALRWLQGRGVATTLSLGGGRRPEPRGGEAGEADGEAWGELVPLVLYQRSLLLGRAGRTLDSEAALRLTLSAHDAANLPARLALSSLLATGGKLDEADVPLREALEAGPTCGVPPAAAANLLEARARLWLHAHGAEIAKSRLAGGGPTAAQASRLDGLADELRLVLATRPGSCAARAALGWVRWLGGDDKAAAEEFNKASMADPTDPLPHLYRAFITGAAISARGDGQTEGEGPVDVDAVRQAAQPFRDAAAQLLQSLPAHAQTAPPHLWIQIHGHGAVGHSRRAGRVAGQQEGKARPAAPFASRAEADPERVVMLGNCVRQLAAAAEACAGEAGHAGAALPLYGYALEILEPLATAHGAAAIEAASVQLARARLLWAAGDSAGAASDLEAASAALDTLAAHAGAAPSLRRMAAAAWCNVGAAREAAAREATHAAAADAAAALALSGGRQSSLLRRRSCGAWTRRRSNDEGGGLAARVPRLGEGRPAGAGEARGGMDLLLGPAGGGGGAAKPATGQALNTAPALVPAHAVGEPPPPATEAHEDRALRLEAEAEACYFRALARWPDHRPSLANLGSLLVAAGRLREALVHLNAAIAGGGEAGFAALAARKGGGGEAVGGDQVEAAARNNRAVASFELGDVAAASRDLAIAAPLHRTARLNLARVAVAGGQWHTAREVLTAMHDEAWRRHARLRLRREDAAAASPQSAHQRAASSAESAELAAAEAEMAVLLSIKTPVEGWCACLDAGVADFGAAARLLFRPAGGTRPAADGRFTPGPSAWPPLTPWQLDVVCGLLGVPLPNRRGGGDTAGSDGAAGDVPPEPLPPPASLPPGVKTERLREALQRQAAGDLAGAEILLCLGEPLRSLRVGRRSEVDWAVLLVWSARSRRDAACDAAMDELHAASLILARACRPRLSRRESSFTAVGAQAEELLQAHGYGASPALHAQPPPAGDVSTPPVPPHAGHWPADTLGGSGDGMLQGGEVGLRGGGGGLGDGEVGSLSAGLHVEIGMRLEEAGQFDAALHQYTEASGRCPSHRPALANAARLLAAQGQPIRAMERYLAMWERAAGAGGAAGRAVSASTAGVHSELCAYLELLRNGPALRLEERLMRQQVQVALAVERWRSQDLALRGRTRAGDFESRLASEACAELLERVADDPARLFGAFGDPMWRETGVDEAMKRLRGALGKG